MMELYTFGRSLQNSLSLNPTSAPTICLKAPEVKILWASWCDMILGCPPHVGENLTYWGTSLNPHQANHLRGTKYNPALKFFGREIAHGVMGFISPSTHEITFYRSEVAIKKGEDPIKTYSFRADTWDIIDIRFMAGDGVLISSRTRACVSLAGGYVVDMPSLARLEESLRSHNRNPDKYVELPLHHCERLAFSPSEWHTNATTFTALNGNGKVYTGATDRRYPKCLGRPFEKHIGPQSCNRAAKIPYFSESTIKKIASGGYYSAAITDDGELYVWGQASPTASRSGELSVLQKEADEDEDEFVRCVKLEVDGRPVTAKDVSIGWGHILVVGEVEGNNPGETWSTVFGAGHNERRQLAREDVDFVEDFAELEVFRGKFIKQVVCAGFSSHVVVEK